jgi:hypothetical protein
VALRAVLALRTSALRDSAPSGIPRCSGFRAVRDSAPFGSCAVQVLRRSGPAPFGSCAFPPRHSLTGSYFVAQQR